MAIVESLTGKIHMILQEPMVIEMTKYTIDASIGIAVYPDAGEDGEILIRDADSAMYEMEKVESAFSRICHIFIPHEAEWVLQRAFYSTKSLALHRLQNSASPLQGFVWTMT